MDEILCHTKDESEDYYKILSCDETSTTEQILAEYKTLSLLFHPDKNPDDKDAVAKFQKLQEAKDVLTDPEKRALYDKWRCSGFCISYEKFLNLNKASHTSIHWATKKKKELMLEGGVLTCDRNLSEGSGKCHILNSCWERDPSENEVLRKFRNYEI